MSTGELAEKIRRLKAYFGADGGVTVSGGEPLMQSDFVAELFSLCHSEGIHCALDTSGCVYNEGVERLLKLTDLVLLDYKYTNAKDYLERCGCKQDTVDRFLDRLEEMGKRVWIRQVIIPGINDGEESLDRLYGLREKYTCIEKIELLPFRKLCLEKYESMGLEFPLKDVPEADADTVLALGKRAKERAR